MEPGKQSMPGRCTAGSILCKQDESDVASNVADAGEITSMTVINEALKAKQGVILMDDEYDNDLRHKCKTGSTDVSRYRNFRIDVSG